MKLFGKDFSSKIFSDLSFREGSKITLPSGQKRKQYSLEMLKKLKVPDIKQLLKNHNLPVSGKKQDLIERLLNPETIRKKRRKSRI